MVGCWMDIGRRDIELVGRVGLGMIATYKPVPELLEFS